MHALPGVHQVYVQGAVGVLARPYADAASCCSFRRVVPCSFLISIMALDSHPLKPGKADVGQRDVPVTVGGVVINPGDWLCELL